MAKGLEIARIPHFGCPMHDIAFVIFDIEVELGMRIGVFKAGHRPLQDEHFMDVVEDGGSVMSKKRNGDRQETQQDCEHDRRLNSRSSHAAPRSAAAELRFRLNNWLAGTT